MVRATRALAYALALALACLAPSPASAVQGSIEDKVAIFSTTGIDRYADGSIVADGECYALVWSPAGKSFSGFNADGSAVSPLDRIVLAAPVAKDGHCPECLFQVPAVEAAALEGGTWAVCLVDTRLKNGVPAGAEGGYPRRVNRWSAVEGGVEFASASGLEATAPAAGLMPKVAGEGIRATILSELPESVERPVVTGMDFDDGVVTLHVAGTVPYLTYTIESGPRLGLFAIDGWADKVEGNDGSEIVLETESTSPTRFFRIIRAE